MKSLKYMAAALLFGIASAATANVAYAEKWDLPAAYVATNFHTEKLVVFADKVRKYTDGKIDITVHPGGSLFGGGDIKRAVQTGQAPIGERFMSAHANELPILEWDNVPFVATTYAENDRLWEAARDSVNKQLAGINLVTLYTCPWPGQGFYFKKPVRSSADIKGVKFRSYNAATATYAEKLGMIPVQIEAAELSQALATGVAESFISSGSTGYDRKVWEHLTHYYKVNAWLPRNYVIINKGVWDGLDGKTQKAIQRAADEAAAECAKESERLANWYFEQLEANGMKVVDAGPEFLAELKAIGAELEKGWVKKTGKDGADILKKFK